VKLIPTLSFRKFVELLTFTKKKKENIGVSKILIQRILLSRSAFYISLGIIIGFALAVVSIWLIWELSLDQSYVKVNSENPTVKFDFERFDITNRPTLGDRDALVTVVELTDYQCPFCKRHNDTVLPRLLAEYGNRIRYVAINFPLTDIHPAAFSASMAAECAHQQDRFWEYRRELFASENGLNLQNLLFIGEQIQLDMIMFETCMKSSDIQTIVDQDILISKSLGVTGTPTFFINDKILVGSRPFGSFKVLIDGELENYGN
tara:strand:+ start:82 stop:867 length:786 start_codon:yes stop_codon:yes gene_type:complete